MNVRLQTKHDSSNICRIKLLVTYTDYNNVIKFTGSGANTRVWSSKLLWVQRILIFSFLLPSWPYSSPSSPNLFSLQRHLLYSLPSVTHFIFSILHLGDAGKFSFFYSVRSKMIFGTYHDLKIWPLKNPELLPEIQLFFAELGFFWRLFWYFRIKNFAWNI